MYIRLTPKLLTQDNELLKPLVELFDSVESAETIFSNPEITLGTKTFNAMVRGLRDIYEVDNNKMRIIDGKGYAEMVALKHIDPKVIGEEAFNQALPFLQEIFENTYGVSQSLLQVTKEEFDAKYSNSELFRAKEVKKKTEDSEQMYYVQNLSSTDSKGNPNFIKNPTIKDNQGPAVKSLNLIARANEKIGNQKIRVTKTDKKKFGRSVYTSAKGILADPVTEEEYKNNLKKLIAIEVQKILREDLGYLQEKYPFKSLVKGEGLKEAVAEIEELLGVTLEDITSRVNSQEPITSETLRQISTFNENGTHDYLRTPLTMKFMKEINDQKSTEAKDKMLQEKVSHRVESVNPTQVQVKIDSSVSQAPKESGFPKQEEGRRSRRSDTDSELYSSEGRRTSSLNMDTIIAELESQGLLKIEC
jgi:hypothetical protein